MKRFNNCRVLKLKTKNSVYISHNAIMLNYLMKKRCIMNDYRYVAFEGGIYEIYANNPINGTNYKKELKNMIRDGKMFSLWLGNKVA